MHSSSVSFELSDYDMQLNEDRFVDWACVDPAD